MLKKDFIWINNDLFNADRLMEKFILGFLLVSCLFNNKLIKVGFFLYRNGQRSTAAKFK